MATKGAKFSLASAAVTKRPAGSSKSPSVSKVPKASDCVVEHGPKTQRPVQRMSVQAPVLVCIYKVTDEACDVWSQYEGKHNVKLWQVQVKHEARPSITFGIVDEFNKLLRRKHASDELVPATLPELQQKAGIRFVIADHADPDGVGFIQWRLAVYVAGDDKALNNFLFLLDDFFMHKNEAIARETPFEIHLHPHTGVNIADAWGDLAYEHYTLHDPVAKLPLGIFEAQPVTGKRIVEFHLQPETEETLSMLVVGHTWNFRGRLDAHGVPGAYYGTEDNRKYIRLMKDINVAEKAEEDHILKMIGDIVFNNLAIRVVLDSQPDEDSETMAFVERLREIPSLHFQVLG